MAKSKVEYWLTSEGLTLLAGWAREGLTDEQIAHNCNIRRQTLYDWMKKYPDISDTLKKNKEIVDYEVENALLRRALGYTIELTEDKLDRDGCVHTLTKEVHIPADTTAQIFWLKNRKRDKWKDKISEEPENGDPDSALVVNDLPKWTKEGPLP